MGNIEPLSGYCKENNTCPPLECCLPIKTYFLETCISKTWLKILGWKDDECPKSHEAFEERLCQVFDEIDIDNNGYLEPEELKAFVEKTGVASADLVNFLIQSFDTNADGHL